MIIIVCADNNNGMMFNNRRQSQDRTLRDHILQLIGTSKLWMNEYSKKTIFYCKFRPNLCR